MRTLIVVDMQNDFVTGSLGSDAAKAIIPNIKKKIDEYIANGDEVIFTRDTHGSNYLTTNEGKHLPVEHCIIKTNGWQVVPELDIPEAEHIDKMNFGFTGWRMKSEEDEDGNRARRLEEVELVGVCTGICVVSNALILKAMWPEIKISVDASCCACVTKESHEAALTTMEMCQIEVINRE